MIGAIILGYRAGSIPFALILARHSGVHDPRRVGSGNPGAANVARTAGVSTGVAVALLDAAKGAASVLAAERFHASAPAAAAAGLAAIVGHIYPVWLGFRGGKGVATACGVFSILTPLAAVPALAIFTISVWITRYVSLGSIAASLALPPLAYVTGSSRTPVATALAAAALIIFRHRENVERLRLGTERRLELGGQ
jgi:glycerol-3-phosphate acyltransferase PlsY